MPLQVPSLEEAHQSILSEFRARLPLADTSPYGDNWKRLRVLAGAVWGLYHFQKSAFDDLFADTAAGRALDRLATIWGLARKSATAAGKASAGRVTGTAASAYTIGDVLTSDSGVQYQLNASGSIPAAGFVDVNILAIDLGAQGFLPAGSTLTFTSPPAGIDAACELQLALTDGGDDAETDPQLRTRLLAKIAQPGMGGNSGDYIQWATAIDGILSAYVYRFRRGLGTVDLVVMSGGTGAQRIPGAAKIAEVQTAIDNGTDDNPARPVSVKGFRAITPAPETVNIDLTVEALQAGDQFDWNDGGAGVAVLTYTAATRVLAFGVGLRPADIAPGSRLQVRTLAGDGTGEQLVVESLSGADAVVLTTDPVAPVPVVSDLVFSGGPLVQPIKDLLLATYLDLLGPDRESTAAGEWLDEIDPRTLEGLVLCTAGVRTSLTVTPSVTVAPTPVAYPNDDPINVLIPGEFIVRRKF